MGQSKPVAIGRFKTDQIAPASTTYVVVPADREAGLLLQLNGDITGSLLPYEVTSVQIVDGKKRKIPTKPRTEFLQNIKPGDVLIGPMGGVGDPFFGAAHRAGARVLRLPHSDIRRSEVEPVALPTELRKSIKGVRLTERGETAAKLAGMYKAGVPFYGYNASDAVIGLIRVHIQQLIAVQDELRKRLQQRQERYERDMELYQAIDGSQPNEYAYRLKFLEMSQSVNELLDLEDQLTKEIKRFCGDLDVFNKVFAPIKGLGPRISARVIAATIDIRRFPTFGSYKKYCGWGTIKKPDGTVAAWKFTRNADELGIKGASPLARQGYWLAGEQINRQGNEFKWYYLAYKKSHADLVGRLIFPPNAPTDGSQAKGKVMTKSWMHKRAMRHAVSMLIAYVYLGWHETIGAVPDLTEHDRQSPIGYAWHMYGSSQQLLVPEKWMPKKTYAPRDYSDLPKATSKELKAAEQEGVWEDAYDDNESLPGDEI